MPVDIPVLADPYYKLPPGTSQLKKFPKVPHLLSHILGPLQVEGASTAGNTYGALALPVMLPHEKNAAPFGLGVQPPEAQQVNVLNIFDDGSEQDQTGTLSSTTLSGFEMGGELNFTHHKGYEPGNPNKPTFGEPAVIPGGISFGSLITGLSTVQVLNFMMGQGNDHLEITGSLVPGPFTYENGTPGTTFVQGGDHPGPGRRRELPVADRDLRKPVRNHLDLDHAQGPHELGLRTVRARPGADVERRPVRHDHGCLGDDAEDRRRAARHRHERRRNALRLRPADQLHRRLHVLRCRRSRATTCSTGRSSGSRSARKSPSTAG